MKDIKEAIYSLITSDTDFKTLTGATVTDKRLYQSHPEKIIDQKLGSWVTYSTSTITSPNDTGTIQDPNIILTFDIWAVGANGFDMDTVDETHETIRVLLDRKQQTTTTDHQLLFIRLDGWNDLPEVQDNMETNYHKNVRYVINGVFRT
jgi:hypothetical protein